MKIRIDLNQNEAEKAKKLGLKVYQNRRAPGGRVYIDNPAEAVETIEKLATEAGKFPINVER